MLPTQLSYATDVSVNPEESSAESTEEQSTLNTIYIKSINPGYTISDEKETGEAIELVNPTGSTITLDNYSLKYITKSGTSYDLINFVTGSQFIGEKVVLRYYKTPEVIAAYNADGNFSKIADATYERSLAMSGGTLQLWSGKEVLDEVCWSGGDSCYKAFSSASPTTLVRDEKTLEFTHRSDYELTFTEPGGLTLPEVIAEDEVEKLIKSQCLDLEFSEVLTYYVDDYDEQFIEIYNPTDSEISLTGCSLKYKKKLYDIVNTNIATENSDNSKISPSGYYVYRTDDFRLTKNPTSENTLELIDVTSETVATLSIPHGQKSLTSYANFGVDTDNNETWKVTYNPTPGAENIYQEFRTCEDGKVINTVTGNCVKTTEEVSETKSCPAGKYLNPLTGRCKKVEEEKDDSCPAGKYRNPLTGRCKKYETTTTKTCPKGKYLNPETNRCKKYETESSLKECKEGYERNPETNRCRKIKTNDGADYALVPVTGTEEKSSFIAIWAIVALAAAAVGYTIWTFRRPIIYKIRKILGKVGR